MGSLFFASLAVVLSLLCVNAGAQTPPLPPTPAKPSQGAQLPPIQVTAKHNKPHTAPTKPATAPAAAVRAPTSPAPPYVTGAPNIAGGAAAPPTMASQMTVTGQDLNARPVARPGEILEAVPGLAVVMHADGGKANQYYLRGYNLDHGTDMATFWDDVPINLPTNAHGQGYTDLNFLLPELAQDIRFTKGPYYAPVGDFGAVGMTIEVHRFARLAAQKLEHRHAGHAALDVPQRLVDAANGVVFHRAVAPVGGVVGHLPDVFDTVDGAAHQQRLEIELHRRLHQIGALGEGAAAIAVQAVLIGDDLDHGRYRRCRRDFLHQPPRHGGAAVPARG